MTLREKYYLTIAIIAAVVVIASIVHLFLCRRRRAKSETPVTPWRGLFFIWVVGMIAMTVAGLLHYQARLDYDHKHMKSENIDYLSRGPVGDVPDFGNPLLNFFWKGVNEGAVEGYIRESVERGTVRVTSYYRKNWSDFLPDMLIVVEYIDTPTEEVGFGRYKLTWYEGDEYLAYSETLDDIMENRFMLMVNYSKGTTSLELTFKYRNADGKMIDAKEVFEPGKVAK